MQELISDLNVKFGNPSLDMKNLTADDHAKLLNQIKFSVEELTELVAAETEKDAIDALGDFVVFLKGFRHLMGAKDDFSTNYVTLGTLIELNDARFDTFEEINSDYPLHSLKNALTPLGYKESLDDLEKALTEHSCNAVATSLFTFDEPTMLRVVAASANETLKPLVQAAISFAFQKDFPKAMFFVDRCIAMAYILCVGSGCNLDKALISIYQSNMTKFCQDQESLDATIKSYADKGVVVVADDSSTFPYKVVRSPEDQEVDGKEYPKGKFLKSVSFKEPDFTSESVAL